MVGEGDEALAIQQISHRTLSDALAWFEHLITGANRRYGFVAEAPVSGAVIV